MRQLYERVSNHPIVSRQPQTVRQFVKFAIVGGINTVLHLGVYILMTRVFDLPVLAANALAFCGAATNSYILNRRWTFRSRTDGITAQFVQFFVVSAIGLGINSLVFYALVHSLQLYDLFATPLAIGVVVLWNFVMNKWWVFRTQDRGKP